MMATEGDKRIALVTSPAAHLSGVWDPNNLQGENGYDVFEFYGNSKLYNVCVLCCMYIYFVLCVYLLCSVLCVVFCYVCCVLLCVLVCCVCVFIVLCVCLLYCVRCVFVLCVCVLCVQRKQLCVI